ncbi:MAG: hypothetical protein KJO29_02780 [Bacteroidia bacterium]|nr:hypothetical protein [Bacteroidia bacterium]
MQNIQFPVTFKFKISTLSNDFTATDARERVIAYVRQKLFKLKEEVIIYDNESRTREIARMKANKWLDFSATYTMYNEVGAEIGKVVRDGWGSIWSARFLIYDMHDNQKFSIDEDNPWVKVADGIFNQIPVVNILTGYFFNPSYKVKDMHNRDIMSIRKTPSFFGRYFKLEKLTSLEKEDEKSILLSLMMMMLLERDRG